MSVRSHKTQFQQSYEEKTKNDVGIFKLLAATVSTIGSLLVHSDDSSQYVSDKNSWRNERAFKSYLNSKS